MTKEKFTYTPDWQFDLINFITFDKNGPKALELIDPGSFTYLTHGVIVEGISRFYKKNRRIPGKTFLKEELLKLLRTKDYANAFSKEEKEEILELLNDLYKPIRDGDLILQGVRQWAAYLRVKEEIEEVNLLNFEDYPSFSKRILQATAVGFDDTHQQGGTLLIHNIEDRQLKRQDSQLVLPTPFKQINASTNAGGYDRGSIIVVLDKPKKGKTEQLVNIARGYLKMKKKIFYVDIENGQDSIATRFEQSLAKVTKRDILSGKYDKYVKKVLRKYRRLGGEVYIKRFPAYSTTASDLQVEMDLMYQLSGLKFDTIVIDFPALMGSTSGKQDDNERISDVYIDLANLALTNDIEHIWAAHHVKREAEKREGTTYLENDIAKCIDIVRHVQAIWGLNRNEYEEENGIVRMELVVQRDGIPHARALFYADHEIQRCDEMNPQEIKEYHKVQKEMVADIEADKFKGDL